MALDNLTVGLPWDVDLSSIRQPTFLWFGERDTFVSDVYSRWWQQQVPHARVTVREGRGHGSAYLVHWEAMLHDLTR